MGAGNHGKTDGNVWADAITLLISSGHTWADIQDYTLAQFKAFIKSAEHMKREQVAALIQASSFAMADGKQVKKAVDSLMG